MDLGATEILIILVVLLLFFGPSKLSGLGASLGKGIREFKKGLSGEPDPVPAPPPAPPAQLAQTVTVAPEPAQPSAAPAEPSGAPPATH